MYIASLEDSDEILQVSRIILMLLVSCCRNMYISNGPSVFDLQDETDRFFTDFGWIRHVPSLAQSSLLPSGTH
jgi:hypothetical protein